MSDLAAKLRDLDDRAPGPASEPVYMGASVFLRPEDALDMLAKGQVVCIGRGTLRAIIAELEQ